MGGRPGNEGSGGGENKMARALGVGRAARCGEERRLAMVGSESGPGPKPLPDCEGARHLQGWPIWNLIRLDHSFGLHY